jgi:hypothetical protein
VLAAVAGLVLLAAYGTRYGWAVRWIGWKVPGMIAGVVVVIGLAVVGAGGLDFEVVSEAPKSVLYRLEYWRSTAAMIADHPLVGCGAGNFQESYAAYKLPQASEMVADPHNFLLEIWATAGTPALVLFLATVVALAVDLMRIARRTPVEPKEARKATHAAVPSSGTFFYAGGIVALVLGFLFAALGDFPLDTFRELPVPIVWCVGGPLLPLVWWLLSPWILEGELPAGAAIVGLLVLAINLLAAGAVVFPGVALTALVLVPVALELAAHAVQDPAASPSTAAGRGSSLPIEKRLSRTMAAGLCAPAFALAVLCLWTEYQPVLNSRLQMRRAVEHLQAGETAAAEKAALAAAGADPWSPEPWRLLAELHFQRFMAEPYEATWSQFVAAADEFRRRNPGHHGQFFLRGNWYFLAWQRGQVFSTPLSDVPERSRSQPARLAAALEAYRQASDRYPNHALYYGQLAWALARSGDQPAARQAADRAKALDDAMPHADQKLARQRIADWQPSSSSAQRHTRPETAEQTVQNLRKTSTR